MTTENSFPVVFWFFFFSTPFAILKQSKESHTMAAASCSVMELQKHCGFEGCFPSFPHCSSGGLRKMI